jgi:hypothetical protein
MEKSRSCEDYSVIGKVSAGVAYAKIQNYFFGDDSIILEGEGVDKKDLAFAATREWLKLNNPKARFGLCKEDLMEVSRYFSDCDYNGCRDVHSRLGMVASYLTGDKRFGGNALLIASAVHSGYGQDACILIRDKG